MVWDLDLTLGDFSALEGLVNLEAPVTVRLRSGIRAALEQLAGEGFAHVLLTLATPAYAETALRGTGLRAHFAEVACAGQRPKGDAEGIAQTHGVPTEEAPHRMIFVGDHPWHDAPSDPRVVFHLEPSALERRAEPLAALILELRRLGEGSLRCGFDALVAHRDPGERIVRRDLPGIGPLLLAPREKESPVIAFDEGTRAGGERGTPVTFVPRSALAGG